MPPRSQTLFGPAVALERAVAAVNAAGPPAAAFAPAAFAGVLRASGEPGPLEGLEAEAGALAAALEELYAIFAAAPDGAAAARLLNAGLARHTAPLRLVEEPGAAWHLHAEPPGDDSWATWFAGASLLALAVHFATHGVPAWGVCSARGCRHVYVQTGPGRPRTTCSPGCAAKKRQAELRARRRATGA